VTGVRSSVANSSSAVAIKTRIKAQLIHQTF